MSEVCSCDSTSSRLAATKRDQTICIDRYSHRMRWRSSDPHVGHWAFGRFAIPKGRKLALAPQIGQTNLPASAAGAGVEGLNPARLIQTSASFARVGSSSCIAHASSIAVSNSSSSGTPLRCGRLTRRYFFMTSEHHAMRRDVRYGSTTDLRHIRSDVRFRG